MVSPDQTASSRNASIGAQTKDGTKTGTELLNKQSMQGNVQTKNSNEVKGGNRYAEHEAHEPESNFFLTGVNVQNKDIE